MPNTTPTKTEVKTSKKYAKTRGEHYKDIVIAILVASIIAFIGGMHFSNQQNGKIANAVKAVTPTVSAQAPASK